MVELKQAPESPCHFPSDVTLTRALTSTDQACSSLLPSTSPSPMLQASSRCSRRLLAVGALNKSLGCIYSARAVCPSCSTRRFHANPSPGPSIPTSTGIQKNHGPRPYWNPPRLPKPAFPKRTILIKGWTPFNNMVEVFAVLRAVEEKYGTIVEYVVSRVRSLPLSHLLYAEETHHRTLRCQRNPLP